MRLVLYCVGEFALHRYTTTISLVLGVFLILSGLK